MVGSSRVKGERYGGGFGENGAKIQIEIQYKQTHNKI